MTIMELRILPPLAVARLGASEQPLENYNLEVSPDDPIGFRRIVGAGTLIVDPATGEIADSYVPKRVRFRDGPLIRPLAPFLEVFARTSDDTLEPLTLDLLRRHKLDPKKIRWTVEVGNLKIFRRTGNPRDRIEAKAEFSDHRPHDLRGLCKNFLPRRVLPLGSVRYIKPNRKFPQIRLRFTPAKGLVYGASTRRKEVDEFNKIVEKPDDIISSDRVLYDTKKGKWRGYSDADDTPSPLQTNPAQIYAGYVDPKSGNQVSWGYHDDECDGLVSVRLAVAGKTLSAFARIGAGPPTFAPDSIPIRTVADELDQVLDLTPAAKHAATDEVPLEEAEEIVRRAVESVRLMNTAVLNGNTVEGRTDAQSTMPRQDTNDFNRFYQPVMTTTSVDNHAVLALHQNSLAALRSGTGAWFAQALRRPDQIGDLTDIGRRKMPALMRGADGRYLTLTRRQIDMVVKAALGSLFDRSKSEGGK